MTVTRDIDISGQVQNFVAIYPDSSTGDAREGRRPASHEEMQEGSQRSPLLTLLPDWNVNASTTDFLAEFGGLHPVLLEACW